MHKLSKSAVLLAPLIISDNKGKTNVFPESLICSLKI
jgi:hypothetical protein